MCSIVCPTITRATLAGTKPTSAPQTIYCVAHLASYLFFFSSVLTPSSLEKHQQQLQNHEQLVDRFCFLQVPPLVCPDFPIARLLPCSPKYLPFLLSHLYTCSAKPSVSLAAWPYPSSHHFLWAPLCRVPECVTTVKRSIRQVCHRHPVASEFQCWSVSSLSVTSQPSCGRSLDCFPTLESSVLGFLLQRLHLQIRTAQTRLC